MSYDVDEEKGRWLLRALLCFIFVCEAAGAALFYHPLNRESLLYLVLALAPTAVVFWAFHRGSWPGMAVFCIGTFNSVSSVTGILAGGAAALSDIPLLVAFAQLLGRLTVLFCIFRSSTVGQYLICRRSYRRRRDNVIEIGLFAVAYAALLLVAIRIASSFLH